MRVTVEPQRVEIAENSTFTVQVTVTNTATVIGGYHLRVLGADPSWVTMEAENLSLFPDTSQTVAATISIPPGVGAGDRRIAVQVSELTPPQAISVTEIELVVPAREAIRMALSPMTVVCGKHGRFSVIAENTGNTAISVVPIGMDPEVKIGFEFLPAVLDLAPGEHVITDLRTTAKRRWFGSPVVRPFSLAAVSPAEAAVLGAPPPPPPAPGDPAPAEPPPEPPEPLAQGSIMQKPKLGRGVLSLLSLLLAVSVFAIVITIALSRLVGVSAADRDLAIQVASARSAGAGTGSSVLGGTVKRISDGQPEPNVTVEVFGAGDLTQPIISTATDAKGTWAVSSMPAGSYKIDFRSAGFAEVWYPNALTGADAKAVQLDAGQKVTNLQVALGGLPATISGQVTGADVAGAVLTVQVPPEFLRPVAKPSAPAGQSTVTASPAPTVVATNAAAHSTPPGLRGPGRLLAAVESPGTAGSPGTAATGPGAAGSAGNAAGAAGSAAPGGVLRTIPIGSDGLFTLDSLPSPAVYDLVVTKVGYATDTQRVDLSGGESRTGILLVLRTGDGLIAGTVTGPNGPLGNAVVTATSGTDTVRTLSLTKGTVGGFSLRGLVTPAAYTVTVTAPGYATVTSTISLTSGQRLQNVLLSLSKAAGSLSGMVTTLADNKPAPGVTVTISSGASAKLTTVTQSGRTAGAWTVAGLPIPGTFTVTFSRSDLQSQTVAVALDSAGHLTSGAGASGGIDVAMRSSSAVVTGTVRQQTGAGTVPVGGATITLTSGEQSYTVTSVSAPASQLGRYEVGNVAPGTYTLSASRKGTSPTTVIVTVTAGQVLSYDPVLVQPASISGTVIGDGAPLPGTEVDLYLSTEYPGKTYAQTTTGPDGRYTFAGVDAPQAYVVEARSPSSGPLASGTIVLAASQAGVLDLTVGTRNVVTSPATSATSAASPSGTSTPPSTPGTSPGTSSKPAGTSSAGTSSAGSSASSSPPRLTVTSLTGAVTGEQVNLSATSEGSPDTASWSWVSATAPAATPPAASQYQAVPPDFTPGGSARGTATLAIPYMDYSTYGYYRVTMTGAGQTATRTIFVGPCGSGQIFCPAGGTP